MSQKSDDPGTLTKVYRTVTPGYRGRDDTEMNTIGWALFLGVVILLVPLLPFLVVLWVVSKVLDAIGR